MSKLLPLTLVLALFVGCGGGGGNPNPPGGGTGDPLVAEAMLDDCASAFLLDLVEYLQFFAPVMTNGTPSPSFQITGTDNPTATIGWMLNLPGGDVLIGSFRFLDQNDMPAAPFDLTQFAASIATLPAMMNQIQPGHKFEIAFQLPTPDILQNGVITFVYAGGAPDTATGVVDVTDQVQPCTFNINFANVAAAGVTNSPTPNTTMSITVTNDDGTLAGTITFNGGNIATLEVTLDGSTFDFEINLTTGDVTRIP